MSDAGALHPSGGGRARRLAGIVGALVLAGSALAMAANALTIRDRAVHTGEADAAPRVATASWIASSICILVLMGIVIGVRSTSQRPNSPALWTAGLCALASACLVLMWTASLWV